MYNSFNYSIYPHFPKIDIFLQTVTSMYNIEFLQRARKFAQAHDSTKPVYS